jgi:hypothetical protein
MHYFWRNNGLGYILGGVLQTLLVTLVRSISCFILKFHLVAKKVLFASEVCFSLTHPDRKLLPGYAVSNQGMTFWIRV